ncbi:MAG: ABC transporter ATP-binding protein [Owenweeksia sp.]|nr:ABC transporter ATP-binding protein [Owenweeksia sp.]MBF99151.1 ABC transporter ATP-binding protein [Owenweeksia sp.]HBF20627.1 ABC transporter ATP-binding protein [Cryomorphaceae bacterium]|tara:strand:- start:2339 stop:4003 length:1665 start_codon:yes stop_codon:yes gene_type:complete
MNEPILQIEDLKIAATELPLVRGLSFSLNKGKTLGIVGESGSGKSLTSLAIMGLLSRGLHLTGKIRFEGKELTRLSPQQYLQIRGNEISMVFQEPMTALNPSMKCGKQVAEILETHGNWSSGAIHKEVLRLFRKVQLPRPEQIRNSYPHQISGGQKQRVMIAMAVACKPKLLIADEPTTALDVTVQADILNLLHELQQEYGMSMIFITHDLGVVHQVADEVLVMYKGEQLEYGTADQVFHQPKNAYTKGLLACRPTAETYFKRLPLVSDFTVNEGSWKPDKLTEAERKSRSLALSAQPPLLEIKNLQKWFTSSGFMRSPEVVKAVNEVSFRIYPGEVLGLVGESGCGKTTLGRVLSGLEKASAGEIFYRNRDITHLSAGEWRRLHRDIQIIFQDPYSSLNPRIPIGKALLEVLRTHKLATKAEARDEVYRLMERVGLSTEHYNRYPHEFSGGQRQRIGIARALALQPEFIICDESVSALDVSVQAQIINLLNDLKDDFGFTYLFISHDLAVVKYISDRIMVMQKGELVETGQSDELYQNPGQEYTRKLISSVQS